VVEVKGTAQLKSHHPLHVRLEIDKSIYQSKAIFTGQIERHSKHRKMDGEEAGNMKSTLKQNFYLSRHTFSSLFRPELIFVVQERGIRKNCDCAQQQQRQQSRNKKGSSSYSSHVVVVVVVVVFS